MPHASCMGKVPVGISPLHSVWLSTDDAGMPGYKLDLRLVDLAGCLFAICHGEVSSTNLDCVTLQKRGVVARLQ